jgi:CheY-like chemotaxis protein
VDLCLPYWPVQPTVACLEPSMSSAEFGDQSSSDKPAPSQHHSEYRTQNSTIHETPRIRVLLVDDHAMVRQGLRSVLESYPDIEVVGEAADGKEALALVERLRPSVIVMDLNMPNMNGIDATAIIKSRHPQIVILGLSVNAGEDNRAAMTEAGAAALLTKEAAVDELYDMINEAVGTRS